MVGNPSDAFENPSADSGTSQELRIRLGIKDLIGL